MVIIVCFTLSDFSVQFSHSVVSDSAAPWMAALQASLSFTNSQSLFKLKSIELVMPSNHLILCGPLLLLPSVFPSIKSFPMSQLFTSSGPSIGASASASVLPMNIQGCLPLGLTGLIFLQVKGLSRVFSTCLGLHLYHPNILMYTFKKQLFSFTYTERSTCEYILQRMTTCIGEHTYASATS